MTSRALCAAVAALLASGCAASRPHERPDVKIPAAWERSAQGASAVPPQGRWWTAFGDPKLDALVEDALRHNDDLAKAAAKVRRARLEAGLAAGAQLPSVSVGADAGVTRTFGRGASTTTKYDLSAGVSWEVDLWGRLASQRSAAEWEASATEGDRQSAALALTGTTATLYWRIGYLKQRLALSAASIAYARKSLDIARARKDAGAGTALDVAQAEQATAGQEAAHTQIEQQLVEARHALSLLFDDGPTVARSEPDAIPASLPAVEARLPADMLARRPDVQAAELRFRAAYATSDATRASFYPTLTLTGALGTASDALRNLLQNPVATLGAGLLLPFVQWRDMQRKREIAQIDAETAVLTYRQTLYRALVDVNDALSARAQYRLQAEKLAASLAAARRAEELSEIRYREGAVAMKVWLDAQEARRQTEVAVLDNGLNQAVSHVTLTEALGGEAASL